MVSLSWGKKFFFFLLFWGSIASSFSLTYHHPFPQKEKSKPYIWEKTNVTPFSEMIFSWNGARPKKGKISFFISLQFSKNFSPYFLFAEWEPNAQRTFQYEQQELGIKSLEDTVTLNSEKAIGFRIKIENSEENSSLNFLHAFTLTENNENPPFDPPLEKIDLPLPILSQFATSSSISSRICSPTSTTAVIRFLKKDNSLDPLLFAEKVRDQTFDIFGNWVLNVAEASNELGNKWSVFVERLTGLNDLIHYLKKGLPVVISIKGPIEGGALPYTGGHLLAIQGYDPKSSCFIAMDPAFPKDYGKSVSYKVHDLEKAWEKRGYVAYVFQLNKNLLGEL